MLKVLMYGDSAIIKKLSNFLGNTSKSQSALIYFEFPNNKFNHPTIVKTFEKQKIYILKPALLKTMLAPKREFESADYMVWVFNWSNWASIVEGFNYFKKVVNTRKSFLPMMFVGYRTQKNADSQDEINFLKLFLLQKEIRNLTQMPLHYFELTENNTEPLLLTQMKLFIEKITQKFGEHSKITRYSSIILENIIKDIIGQIKHIKDQEYSFDDLIGDLVEFEVKKGEPITRRYLEQHFGCNPEISTKLTNIWNHRPSLNDISENALTQLQKEAEEMWTSCIEANSILNYVELVKEGYSSTAVQYVLRYLFETGKLTTISHHIESEEYIEFRNIREVVVLYEGRTLFVKTTNPNPDQTLQFSNMIQAIEMVRNEYISKSGGKDVKPSSLIEFLEFGDLFAIIGNGNKGVKLILRLNNRPHREGIFKHRVKNFLVAYENQVSLNATNDLQEQRKIRELSEKAFYRNFNPFPLNVDVFQLLSINGSSEFEMKFLSEIEIQIVEVLQEKGSAMLEDLVDKVTKLNNFLISRSDILQYILDLRKDKIII
jgi:hypothetical protein